MLELEENAFQNIIKSQKVIIKVQGLLKMISSYVSYSFIHTKTCVYMLLAALFIIVITWKQ